MKKDNKKDLRNTKKKEKTNLQKKSNVKNASRKKVNKVVKEEVKSEKWYVWLKNNIIENEKNFSKEYKHRRLLISMFAVFCFFSILFSAIMIDYSNARKYNQIPYFTIKTRDEYKQMTVYRGLFYKIWKCDHGSSSLNYATLSTPMSYCEIEIIFNEEGLFINPNRVKLTKSEINIIKPYYFDNYIYFKTQTEAKNAYKISKAINEILWIQEEPTEIINNDESVNLAIFGKSEIIDNVETFKFQFNDINYYKCVKQEDNNNSFATYNYLDNTCDESWQSLSLDNEICKIAKKTNNSIKNSAIINDYCK